jgi:hypothetical protein
MWKASEFSIRLEGGGLINARSSTRVLGAASGGALPHFMLVSLLAGVNQPYHHTISYALFPSLLRVFVR